MNAAQIEAVAEADAHTSNAALPTYSELLAIAKAARRLHAAELMKLINELNPYPEALQKKLMTESTWVNAKTEFDAVDCALKKLPK